MCERVEVYSRLLYYILVISNMTFNMILNISNSVNNYVLMMTICHIKHLYLYLLS